MHKCSEIMKDCPELIQYFSQTGRFDLVTTLLAAIGLVLVVGGVIAYFDIKRSAKKKARKVAEEYVKEETEKLFNIYIQKNWPSIIELYGNMAKEQVKEDQAEIIAKAQEDEIK